MQTRGRVAAIRSASLIMACCRTASFIMELYLELLNQKPMLAPRCQWNLFYGPQTESNVASKLLQDSRPQKLQRRIVAAWARHIIERYAPSLRLMKLELPHAIKGAVMHVDRGHGNQPTCRRDNKLL